ncbi:MAG: RNA polymerase sigma factor [Acidimicrobiia bacterium]
MATNKDEARFRDLHDRYQARILAYCLRRAPGSDAADAAAETFLVAWRRIGEIPAGEQALVWLYGVARRVLANNRRSLGRRRRLQDRLSGLPVDVMPAVDTLVIRKDESQELVAALGRLRRADQEVLRLVAWEELPRTDIARILGCSRDAVDHRFHRAIRRLSDQLKGSNAHHSTSTTLTEGAAS